MSNKDDFADIPPLIPSRDQVDTHIINRRSQGQEIVNSGYSPQTVKVSTWPVRILLTLIVLTLGAAAYGAYLGYEIYQDDLRADDLRLQDLERRLSLAGESTEESAINMIERMDFNFSEIDKLWAARRVINSNIENVQSELAKLTLTNSGQDEAAANNAKLIAAAEEKVTAVETRLNTMATTLEQVNTSVASLGSSITQLQSLQADIESIRQAMDSGDDNLLGIAGRLEFLEQGMESVDAHRLQINETLFGLQESLETLQTQITRANGL